VKKQECAIIMAHTGIVLLQGDDFNIFHRYIEKLLGGPVYTHELADIEVWSEIKEKSRPDFEKLMRELED